MLKWIEYYHSKLPYYFYRLFEKFVPDLVFRYLSVGDFIRNAVANRGKSSKAYDLDELLVRKKGDTLFILGCNESINQVDELVWERLKDYDTIGFNYWMYHHFVPTYFGFEYSRDPRAANYQQQLFRKRAADYSDTIFLVSSRARRRGMVPRLIPEFFAAEPKVFYYTYPQLARCPKTRPFAASDFEQSILYRGSFNCYLHIARLLQYKKIVLLGCEMNIAVSFYDDLPDVQWMNELEGYQGGFADNDVLKKNSLIFTGRIKKSENSNTRGHTIPTRSTIL